MVGEQELHLVPRDSVRQKSSPYDCVLTLPTIVVCLSLLGSFTACKTVEFPNSPARARPVNFVVDSSAAHVNPQLVRQTTTATLDSPPDAWGRYVINRAAASSESSGARELSVAEFLTMRTISMRLVPIVAPQQTDLSKGIEAGQALAVETAGILSALVKGYSAEPASRQILVFLDVEGDRYPLSPEFLVGWCKGLRAASTQELAFLPAVYTNAGTSARKVRQVLVDTVDACKVEGLWLASYISGTSPPGAWKDFKTDTRRQLPALPDAIPVYVWQYRGGNKVDLNVLNPDLADAFLQKTVALW